MTCIADASALLCCACDWEGVQRNERDPYLGQRPGQVLLQTLACCQLDDHPNFAHGGSRCIGIGAVSLHGVKPITGDGGNRMGERSYRGAVAYNRASSRGLRLKYCTLQNPGFRETRLPSAVISIVLSPGRPLQSGVPTALDQSSIRTFRMVLWAAAFLKSGKSRPPGVLQQLHDATALAKMASNLASTASSTTTSNRTSCSVGHTYSVLRATHRPNERYMSRPSPILASRPRNFSRHHGRGKDCTDLSDRLLSPISNGALRNYTSVGEG